MPTRRAIRPDSRHHRDARRQRITRAGGHHGMRIVWAIIAAVSALGLTVAGLLAIFGKAHSAAVMWTIYMCAAALLAAILAVLFSR